MFVFPKKILYLLVVILLCAPAYKANEVVVDCNNIVPSSTTCPQCGLVLNKVGNACISECPIEEYDNVGHCTEKIYKMQFSCIKYGSGLDIYNKFPPSSGIQMEQAFWDSNHQICTASQNSINREDFINFRIRDLCPLTQGKKFMCLMAIEWYVPKDSRFTFGFGFDGNAARLVLNEEEVNFAKQEWWWANNRNLLWINEVGILTAGQQKMQLLFYEECCDGAQSYFFGVNEDNPNNFIDLSIDNLKNLPNLDVDISEVPCENFQSCNECVNAVERPDCAWCDLNGGGCKQRDAVECTDGNIYDPKSRVKSFTGFSESDSIKPPRQVVELRNGLRLKVPLKIRQKKFANTTTMVLIDNTESVGGIADGLAKLKTAINANEFDSVVSEVGSDTYMSFTYALSGTKPYTRFDTDTKATPNHIFETVGSIPNSFTDFQKTPYDDLKDSSAAAQSSIIEGLLQTLKCQGPSVADSRVLVLIATNTISQLQYTYETPENVHVNGANKDFREKTRGRYASFLRHDGECTNNNLAREAMLDVPGTGQLREALKSANAVPVVLHGNAGGKDFWSNFIETGLNGLGVAQTTNNNDFKTDALSALAAAYKQITGTIQISPISTTDRITYAQTWSEPIQDATVGIDYSVFVSLLSIGNEGVDISTKDLSKPLHVNVLGLGEALIDIVAVSCDCAENELQDSDGNKVGVEVCGRTTCETGNFGRNCLCNSTNADNACPVFNGLECGGAGTCICGNCVCFPGYEDKDGNPCSCPTDPLACGTEGGQICGGDGTCNCGVCDCAAGKSGKHCECTDASLQCDGDPNICSNNGVCYNISTCNRACQCNNGFHGDACECTRCTKDCGEAEGTGTCGCDGTCQCEAGYDKDQDCKCLTTDTCAGGCGNGVCNCGICTCFNGFSGENCECSPQGCASDCGANETMPRGTCECNQCKCNEGWNGPNCDCPDDQKCPTDDNGRECSGNGDCLASGANCGVCSCSPGYASPDSNNPDCSCLKVECPIDVNNNECSNNGVCNDCGVCQCTKVDGKEYVGSSCQCDKLDVNNQCPGLVEYANGTKGYCNGNGRCRHDDQFCGQCECFNPQNSDSGIIWTGEACDCNNNLCPVTGGVVCGIHSTNECKECTGECICTDGYTQPMDENGVVDATKGCICSNQPCPAPGGNECNGKGSCTPCGCECTDGWSGVDCSICPQDQNITSVKEIGESCNLVVLETQTNCTEPACLSCNQFDGNCEQCQDRKDVCVWCSGLCMTFNEADRLCTGTRNDQCTVTEETQVGLYVGVSVGAVAILAVGLLLYKGIISYMDHMEWQEFNKSKGKPNWATNKNVLYETSGTESVNPLAQTD